MYVYWWLIFGVLAIIAAIFNVVFTLRGKDSRLFMFLSLSLTILTLCTSFMEDQRIAEHIGFVHDVMFSPLLFSPAIASIVINSVGLLKRKK